MANLLVYLAVKLVEDFAEHAFDLGHVYSVVVAGDVVQRHTAHVSVQPVDGLVDAIERPAAKESRHGHGDVEQDLVVHD